MASLPIHIAHWKRGVENGPTFYEVVVEDEYNENTDGSPTVDEYLALEADDGYLPLVASIGNRIITADVSAINSA